VNGQPKAVKAIVTKAGIALGPIRRILVMQRLHASIRYDNWELHPSDTPSYSADVEGPLTSFGRIETKVDFRHFNHQAQDNADR